MASSKNKPKFWQRGVRLFFTGFAMGSADIVPGVSGGTIAFIAGVYEELIYSIKTASGEALRLLVSGKIKAGIEAIPWRFLVPLGLGLLTALFTLSRLISYLLETYPIQVWAFFFGLVLASVMLIRKRVVTWNAHDLIALAAAALVAYFIVGSGDIATPDTLFFLFLAGAIAICAMILPGVSGSFLLIIMGKYAQILEAVVQRDFISLSVFGLGAVLGIVLFARVVSYLFREHHDIVVSVLIGFMLGSLRLIWPWKVTILTRINSHGIEVPIQQANILPPEFNLSVVLALLAALVAVIFVYYLDKLQVIEEQVGDVEDSAFAREHKQAIEEEKQGKI